VRIIGESGSAKSAGEILISAGTLAEALIVAGQCGIGSVMQRLVRGLGCEVVPVSGHDAPEIATADARWGKGVHRAGLNYGDCFACVLARRRACPLLFGENECARTDIARAM